MNYETKFKNTSFTPSERSIILKKYNEIMLVFKLLRLKGNKNTSISRLLEDRFRRRQEKYLGRKHRRSGLKNHKEGLTTLPLLRLKGGAGEKYVPVGRLSPEQLKQPN